MAGLSRWRRATERAYGALREAEHALGAERARVAAAEAEADFAAHAHEELTKLAVEPGEEETLAARRQAMMQGEKVAADIRDAREQLTGDAADPADSVAARAATAAARCAGAGAHRAQRQGARRGDRGDRARHARSRRRARLRFRSQRA